MVKKGLRKMSGRWAFVAAIAVVALSNGTSVAHAQLIGNRTVGNAPGNIQQTPPSGRLGAGSFTNMRANSGPMGAGGMNLGTTQGGIQTNGRFVRGNRARGDFVGSNRTELKGFVGSGQALGVGRVTSAVENIKVESRAARINRPMPSQPKKGMYYPRLELDLSSRDTPELIPATPASLELSQRVSKVAGIETKIQIRGRTAIIDTSSIPPESLDLVKTLLSFEPGIDSVE
ncbi:MAG: hypothetical protein KGQ51_13480 [Planctomycetes bacterium]|nr:hypothetical protein [Planctomycetota bacterium]